jgi:hypothetical protein
VEEFFVVTLKQTGVTIQKIVGFNYIPSYDRHRLGRRFAQAISKCEGALPDTYGKRAEDLASVLNSYLNLIRLKNAEKIAKLDEE